VAVDALYVAARRAAGTEGCLVDKQALTIASLEGADDRAFSIAVAGPAALVVAKTHKIAGRRDEGRGY
jgi:hypothetical protein